MQEFKKGDRVRYVGGSADGTIGYLVGHTGTVTKERGSYGFGVKWDAPYPVLDFQPLSGGSREVTWEQFFDYPDNFELESPVLDKTTVDALVAHMRGRGLNAAPDMVEVAYAELTQPKTHTVVVEFEVDSTFDIVGVLTDLEEDHDGIRSVDVKED